MTSSVAPRSAETRAAEVRAASMAFLQAAGSHDPERIARFYARDGAFMVPNAPIARGRGAVRAVWEQLLTAPGLTLVWTTDSVEVAEAGDLACEIGSYRLGMDGPGGRIEDEGKYVVVWRRSGDAWEVAADIFNSSRPLPGASR